ncbi:MAG: hypothetical protein JWM82_2368 [Myxococcales bacterium]|nr:hypothetical protein [Myxococcales bacterium]
MRERIGVGTPAGCGQERPPDAAVLQAVACAVGFGRHAAGVCCARGSLGRDDGSDEDLSILRRDNS